MFHILDIAQQFAFFARLEIGANKRILTGLFRIVQDQKSLHYQELLSKLNPSDLCSIRCQDMMKTVFKAIQFGTMPKYKRGLLQMRNTTYKDQGNL